MLNSEQTLQDILDSQLADIKQKVQKCLDVEKNAGLQAKAMSIKELF